MARPGADARRLGGLGDLLVVVGFLDGMPDAPHVLGTPKGAPQNAAAFVHRGEVVGRYAKHHLPNYGVFDEYRYFVPGSSLTVARVHGVDVAVVICEDIWQEGGPVARTREAGAGLLVVINGSPYERNKDDVRLDLVAAPGRRRPAARSPTSTWSAARTSWSSTATRSSSSADGRGARPGTAVRGGLLVVDLDLPAATGWRQPGRPAGASRCGA